MQEKGQRVAVRVVLPPVAVIRAGLTRAGLTRAGLTRAGLTRAGLTLAGLGLAGLGLAGCDRISSARESLGAAVDAAGEAATALGTQHDEAEAAAAQASEDAAAAVEAAESARAQIPASTGVVGPQPCTLLTAAEITEITTATVGEGVRSQANLGARQCGWSDDLGRGVLLRTGDAATMLEAHALIALGGGARIVGVGDGGAFDPTGLVLSVVINGGGAFQLRLLPGTAVAGTEEAVLTELAARALTP